MIGTIKSWSSQIIATTIDSRVRPPHLLATETLHRLLHAKLVRKFILALFICLAHYGVVIVLTVFVLCTSSQPSNHNVAHQDVRL